MAEIRKHNPTTSDIGEQVRALMGETIRPVTPGAPEHQIDDEMYDPYSDVEASDDQHPAPGSSIPDNVIPFTAGGGPLIGTLPQGFNPWVFDDNDPAA